MRGGRAGPAGGPGSGGEASATSTGRGAGPRAPGRPHGWASPGQGPAGEPGSGCQGSSIPGSQESGVPERQGGGLQAHPHSCAHPVARGTPAPPCWHTGTRPRRVRPCAHGACTQGHALTAQTRRTRVPRAPAHTRLPCLVRLRQSRVSSFPEQSSWPQAPRPQRGPEPPGPWAGRGSKGHREHREHREHCHLETCQKGPRVCWRRLGPPVGRQLPPRLSDSLSLSGPQFPHLRLERSQA